MWACKKKLNAMKFKMVDAFNCLYLKRAAHF